MSETVRNRDEGSLQAPKELVGARGFEPPTSRSQTERTTRLCYAPCPCGSTNGRAILASARIDGQGTQEFRGFFQGLRPVTYFVLNSRRQFGKRLVKARRNEDRIISEAIRAPPCVCDFAETYAPGHIQNCPGSVSDNNGGYESRRSIGAGRPGEFKQQLLHAFGI